MDVKAMARSKRSHTKHHQKPYRPKPLSTPSSSSSIDPKAAKGGDKKGFSHSNALPSNWDRYSDSEEDDEALPAAVVKPKSKGADFGFLLSQAKSQSPANVSASFDDMLPEIMAPRSGEEMRRRLVERACGGKTTARSSGSASAGAPRCGSGNRPWPSEAVGRARESDAAVGINLDDALKSKRAEEEPACFRPSKKQKEPTFGSSALQPILSSFLAKSVSCDPSRFAMKTAQEKLWEVVGVLNNFAIPALARLAGGLPPWASGPSFITAQLEAKVARVSKEAEEVLRDFKELKDGYAALEAENDQLKKKIDKYTKERDDYKEELCRLANYVVGLKEQFDGHAERAVRQFMDSEYLSDVVLDVAAGQVKTGWNHCRVEVRRRLADPKVEQKEPPAAGFEDGDEGAWSDPAPPPLTFEWPEPIPAFGSPERPGLPDLNWSNVRRVITLHPVPCQSADQDEGEEDAGSGQA